MMTETNRIEFKRELTRDLDLEREVMAFLNYREGGIIYFGIDDDGNAVGVKDIDGDILKIKDRIRTGVSPSPIGLFDVMVEHIGNTPVIKVFIASGSEKPYYKTKYGLSEKGCFMRVGTAAEPMTNAQIEDLYDEKNNVGSLSEIQLTDRQKKICLILKENPNVSAKTMSEVLSVVQRTVERDLAVLQQKGVIKHCGNTSGGHCEVIGNEQFTIDNEQ
ncbi:MAG: putative DNA binding domain-containing protein [Bacteroidales bacterium]|nr:putative DNA binding domain-containing protein [Bacteroidales bacterium]